MDEEENEELCYDMPTVMYLLEPVFSALMGAYNYAFTEAEINAGISEEEIRNLITDVFEIPDEVASNPVYSHRVNLALQYLMASDYAAPADKPGYWKLGGVEFNELEVLAKPFDINEISRKYHDQQREKPATGNVLQFKRKA